MARSLLRASQLRDEDVMEEAEHDAWVHVNLVTSGTVNFQDGTISGTGDIYATTLYGDGSNLSGVGGEAAALYYSGTKVMESYISGTDEGFKLTHTGDGTGDATDIFFTQSSYGHLTIDNPTYQGRFIVKGTKGGDADSLMIQAYPHSSVELYTSGLKSFETQSGGIRLWSGSNTTRLYQSGLDFNFYNLEESGRYIFRGENAASDLTYMAIFDPDGAAELYYAGDKTVETTVSGIKINSGGEVRSDGTNVEFYHDGNKALETLSDGISINTNAYIQHDATDLIITNKTNAGALRFYANNGPDRERMQINTNNQTFGNTGATELYLDHNNGDIYLKASPNDYIWVRDRGAHHIEFHTNSKLAMDMDDGSVDLYYDGNKKFETTVSGIEVTGAIEQNGERIYTQSEVDELITTLSGALQAQIDTLLAL